MSWACLVANVACEHALIGETGRKRLGVAEITTTIIPHINDEAAAEGKGMEAFVKVSLSDGTGEGGNVDVADIVG